MVKSWHAEVITYSSDPVALKFLRDFPDIIGVEQMTPEGINITFDGPEDWDTAHDAIMAVVRAAYGSHAEMGDLQESTNG